MAKTTAFNTDEGGKQPSLSTAPRSPPKVVNKASNGGLNGKEMAKITPDKNFGAPHEGPYKKSPFDNKMTSSNTKEPPSTTWFLYKARTP